MFPAPLASLDLNRAKRTDDSGWFRIPRECYISNDGFPYKDIIVRICKASQTLRRLCVLMSNQHNSRQSTKLKAYNAVHLAWRMTGGLDTLQKTLEAARTILLPQPKVNPLHPLAGLNLTRITDLEVLERAGRVNQHRRDNSQSPAPMDEACHENWRPRDRETDAALRRVLARQRKSR